MGLLNYLKLRQRRRKLERQGPAKRRKQEDLDQPETPTKPTWGVGLVSVIAILMVWGASSFSLLYQPEWDRDLEVVPGMPVTADQYARVDFSFVDLQETEEARNIAGGQVNDIFIYNHESNQKTRSNLDDLLNFLDSWGGITPDSETENPTENAGAELNDRFGNYDPEYLEQLRLLFDGRDRRNFLVDELDKLLTQGIISETAQRIRTEDIFFTYDDKHSRTIPFDEVLTPSTGARRMMQQFCEHIQVDFTEQHMLVSDLILSPLLIPNLRYSHERSASAREEVRANILPIRRTIKKDMLILEQSKNRKITPQDIAILKAHRQQLVESRSSSEYLKHIAQMCGWSLLLTIAGAAFFGIVMYKTCQKSGNIILIALVLSAGILLIWGTTQFILNVRGESPIYLYPALPIIFSAALLSLLLGPREGMAAGVWVSLLASLQGGDATHIVVLGVSSSVAVALSIHSARTRIQTFRAAAYPPIVVMLVEFIFLFRHTSILTNWPDFLIFTGIAFVNCFLILILVNIFLPILEYFFDLTTNISLLELSDLNHPLLRRLSLEAPGTYTHTMMVATLAEHAAEAIGANTLLTRVAAYFHDIGKLSNPDYFTENSFDEDMHEALSPKMSSLIILNHVKEGLALARKYKLKPPLREAITTHHGTSLVYFFYHRAKTEKTLEAGGGEHEFRYPGPRPRSAAATIICLCDPCEAASRSLEKPTPQKISVMVNDIFMGKLRDGQLDNSELTMAELHTVRESIKKTLRVMLHSRIAYPKEENEDNVNSGGEKMREVPRKEILNEQATGNGNDSSPAATRALTPDTEAAPKVDPGELEPETLPSTSTDQTDESNTTEAETQANDSSTLEPDTDASLNNS